MIASLLLERTPALRAALALRLNLNWLFDPRTAWQRREPLRMPKQGMASPPSEIARLFAEWTAARAALNLRAKDGRFDNEPDPHFEAMMRAEDAMMPIPAKTPADLAMKIYAAHTGDVVDRCPSYEPLFLEIEALVGVPEK